MTRTFFRHKVSALAALTLISIFASSPVSAQTHELGHWMGIMGLTQVQSLRTCISRVSPGASSDDQAWTVIVVTDHGHVALERELRVPALGFQCIDVPYAEIVAAAILPDPATGAVTFRVDILSPRGRAETVGANQTRTVGAVMSIDTATGKIGVQNWIFLDSPQQGTFPPG